MLKTKRRLPKDPRVKAPLPVRPFTLDEYHKLIQVGILTEDDRVELLDGWIVPKVPQDEPHAATVEWLTLWLAAMLDATRWRMRCQLPITLPGDNEPEPDLVVAAKLGILGRHPGQHDIRLVIEVADSSLLQDRKTKLQLYASTGIPEYWIVNLVDRCVEVFTQPAGRQYAEPRVCKPGDEIAVGWLGKRGGKLNVAALFQNIPT